ncbi:MAG: glycosyltransferase [Acidimicrobiales bacterium]
MSAPLDELLISLGIDPVVPVDATTEPFLTAVVRTQGRRPDALADALESLAAQTDPGFEVLVVVHDDDPDTAGRVGRDLERTGRPLPSRWRALPVAGGGRSRPLNTGLDAATGRYVAFLDDDDLALPEWVATFRRGAESTPGAMVRAVTATQTWTTDGGDQPVRPTGEIERPFAGTFDLLAHLDHNETPICSVALPMAGLRRFGLRFDEELPVLEDWDLIVRTAALVGVVSLRTETALYRRLDSGNAHDRANELTWHRTVGHVLDKLSAVPLLLPAGSARRIATARFLPDGGSAHAEEAANRQTPEEWRTEQIDSLRHDLAVSRQLLEEETARLTDLAEDARARLAAVESSPWWRITGPARRLVTALKHLLRRGASAGWAAAGR